MRRIQGHISIHSREQMCFRKASSRIPLSSRSRIRSPTARRHLKQRRSSYFSIIYRISGSSELRAGIQTCRRRNLAGAVLSSKIERRCRCLAKIKKVWSRQRMELWSKEMKCWGTWGWAMRQASRAMRTSSSLKHQRVLRKIWIPYIQVSIHKVDWFPRKQEILHP